MVISGVHVCSFCGEERDFGENFNLPPAPFSIKCKKCKAPLIQSVPEDLMDDWANQIENDLTEEERQLLGRE